MKTVIYPAIFYKVENHFLVALPDFDRATQGTSLEDAFAMGADCLGILVANDIMNNRTLPKASDINALTFDSYNWGGGFEFDKSDSFISMVTVNLKEYLEADKPVKKTLSIPKWADQLGQKLHLNFSQTLTEAIVSKSEAMHAE